MHSLISEFSRNIFRFLKPQDHLDKTWYHDAEREAYGIIHGLLIAMEEVDELAIALRHDIGKYIRHRIVHPVEQDARNKTLGAIIHPTQKQAHQEGIDKLRQIGMNQSEDGCRNHDGYPMVLLAHDAQQGAEDGSTEHDLLGKRRQIRR